MPYRSRISVARVWRSWCGFQAFRRCRSAKSARSSSVSWPRPDRSRAPRPAASDPALPSIPHRLFVFDPLTTLGQVFRDRNPAVVEVGRADPRLLGQGNGVGGAVMCVSILFLPPNDPLPLAPNVGGQ